MASATSGANRRSRNLLVTNVFIEQGTRFNTDLYVSMTGLSMAQLFEDHFPECWPIELPAEYIPSSMRSKVDAYAVRVRFPDQAKAAKWFKYWSKKQFIPGFPCVPYYIPDNTRILDLLRYCGAGSGTVPKPVDEQDFQRVFSDIIVEEDWRTTEEDGRPPWDGGVITKRIVITNFLHDTSAGSLENAFPGDPPDTVKGFYHDATTGFNWITESRSYKSVTVPSEYLPKGVKPGVKHRIVCMTEDEDEMENVCYDWREARNLIGDKYKVYFLPDDNVDFTGLFFDAVHEVPDVISHHEDKFKSICNHLHEVIINEWHAQRPDLKRKDVFCLFGPRWSLQPVKYLVELPLSQVRPSLQDIPLGSLAPVRTKISSSKGTFPGSRMRFWLKNQCDPDGLVTQLEQELQGSWYTVKAVVKRDVKMSEREVLAADLKVLRSRNNLDLIATVFVVMVGVDTTLDVEAELGKLMLRPTKILTSWRPFDEEANYDPRNAVILATFETTGIAEHLCKAVKNKWILRKNGTTETFFLPDDRIENLKSALTILIPPLNRQPFVHNAVHIMWSDRAKELPTTVIVYFELAQDGIFPLEWEVSMEKVLSMISKKHIGVKSSVNWRMELDSKYFTLGTITMSSLSSAMAVLDGANDLNGIEMSCGKLHFALRHSMNFETDFREVITQLRNSKVKSRGKYSKYSKQTAPFVVQATKATTKVYVTGLVSPNSLRLKHELEFLCRQVINVKAVEVEPSPEVIPGPQIRWSVAIFCRSIEDAKNLRHFLKLECGLVSGYLDESQSLQEKILEADRFPFGSTAADIHKRTLLLTPSDCNKETYHQEVALVKESCFKFLDWSCFFGVSALDGDLNEGRKHVIATFKSETSAVKGMDVLAKEARKKQLSVRVRPFSDLLDQALLDHKANLVELESTETIAIFGAFSACSDDETQTFFNEVFGGITLGYLLPKHENYKRLQVDVKADQRSDLAMLIFLVKFESNASAKTASRLLMGHVWNNHSLYSPLVPNKFMTHPATVLEITPYLLLQTWMPRRLVQESVFSEVNEEAKTLKEPKIAEESKSNADEPEEERDQKTADAICYNQNNQNGAGDGNGNGIVDQKMVRKLEAQVSEVTRQHAELSAEIKRIKRERDQFAQSNEDNKLKMKQMREEMDSLKTALAEEKKSAAQHLKSKAQLQRHYITEIAHHQSMTELKCAMKEEGGLENVRELANIVKQNLPVDSAVLPPLLRQLDTRIDELRRIREEKAAMHPNVIIAELDLNLDRLALELQSLNLQSNGKDDSDDEDDSLSQFGAAARPAKKNHFQKVIEAIQEVFPESGRDELLHYLKIVKDRHGGTFKKQSVNSIIEEISTLMETMSFSAAECSICLAALRDQDTIKKMDVCGHEFHEDCIAPWLQDNQDCPNCRQPINPNDNGQQNRGRGQARRPRRNRPGGHRGRGRGGGDHQVSSSPPAGYMPLDQEQDGHSQPRGGRGGRGNFGGISRPPRGWRNIRRGQSRRGM